MGRPAGAPPSPAASHQPPFVTLGELVAGVADGSRVGVGGALLTRLPLTAVHALAARPRPGAGRAAGRIDQVRCLSLRRDGAPRVKE